MLAKDLKVGDTILIACFSKDSFLETWEIERCTLHSYINIITFDLIAVIAQDPRIFVELPIDVNMNELLIVTYGTTDESDYWIVSCNFDLIQKYLKTMDITMLPNEVYNIDSRNFESMNSLKLADVNV